MDKEAFTFAMDSAKQIITISSATLALTVTFAKDTFLKDRKSPPWSLYVAWSLYLIAILCSIWTMLALTGEFGSRSVDSRTIWGTNVTRPALAMVVTFYFAFVFTVVAGWQSFRREAPTTQPPIAPPPDM